jgi:uncharacterized membrane protein YciS (DUF1049 family)
MRPFMGFMLSSSNRLALPSTSSSQSLQRLVKKKEEHMETVAIVSESTARQLNLKPLKHRLSMFFFKANLLLSNLHKQIKQATKLSDVSPDNHLFRQCLAYRI